MKLNKLAFFIASSRYCCTVPVSTTGSLWTGFGGFRYAACRFLLTKVDPHLGARTRRNACQFIQPGVDYVAQPVPSRHLRSRLREWVRINETLALLVLDSRKMAA